MSIILGPLVLSLEIFNIKFVHWIHKKMHPHARRPIIDNIYKTSNATQVANR